MTMDNKWYGIEASAEDLESLRNAEIQAWLVASGDFSGVISALISLRVVDKSVLERAFRFGGYMVASKRLDAGIATETLERLPKRGAKFDRVATMNAAAAVDTAKIDLGVWVRLQEYLLMAQQGHA
jgi:hypothetical protein